MIRRVIYWQNGMLMVFDQNGQQMPEYQGPFEEAKKKILSAIEGHNVHAIIFEKRNWNTNDSQEISAAEFKKLA